MAAARAYNLYVGAETGLLKGIHTADRTWQNLNAIGSANRSKEITCLCWGNDDQSEICVGLRNNSVLTTDASGTITSEIDPIDCTSGHIKAIAKFGNQFVTGFSNGTVTLWHEHSNEEEVTKIETGDNLWALCQNTCESNQIATGGKENPLKLWDLNNSTKPFFTAKNVRNDWLNLRVPVWVTRTSFLGDGRRVVTGTGHHQIYVYDPGTPQRRPVLEMHFLEHPITALAVRPGIEHQLVVGNTVGDMGLLDLRHGKVMQLYKGFSGGVTDIQCHTSLPFIASCSIDRFVRIHSIDNKSVMMKFYLKSRLNCLLLTDFWPDEQEEGRKEETKHQGKMTTGTYVDDVKDEANCEDSDAVWESLDVVKTKTVRQKGKKHKSLAHISETANETVPKKKTKGNIKGK